MILVRLTIEARGHYSDAKYEETIWITKDTYEKIKEVSPIFNSELRSEDDYIFIPNLDGKHSEVKSELIEEGEYYEEDLKFKMKNFLFPPRNKECLYCTIDSIAEELNINFDEETDKINEYLERILKESKTIENQKIKSLKILASEAHLLEIENLINEFLVEYELRDVIQIERKD